MTYLIIKILTTSMKTALEMVYRIMPLPDVPEDHVVEIVITDGD